MAGLKKTEVNVVSKEVEYFSKALMHLKNAETLENHPYSSFEAVSAERTAAAAYVGLAQYLQTHRLNPEETIHLLLQGVMNGAG